MRDIGPVVTLALHHERLGPDRFLDRTEIDASTEHFGLFSMTKPFIVDPRRTVAGAENQVGEIFAAIRLAEPVGKRELGMAADGGERVQIGRASCRERV